MVNASSGKLFDHRVIVRRLPEFKILLSFMTNPTQTSVFANASCVTRKNNGLDSYLTFQKPLYEGKKNAEYYSKNLPRRP